MTGSSEGTAFFEVEACDPAQTLSRLLGLFAQQDRPLASVVAHSSGDRLNAMLRLSAIDAHRARVIAEKLRAMAMVERVEFTFAPKRRASVAGSRLRRSQDAQHVSAGHLVDVGG